MIDREKMHTIYEEMKNIQPLEAFDLAFQTNEKQEQEFLISIGNYLLQQRQKEVIRKGVF